MSSKIIEAEQLLDSLLPVKRLEQSPPAELMAAAKAWSQAVWARAVEAGPISLSNGDIAKSQVLAARPVYICGVHRSGTTLVRDLLDGHPELVVLPSEGTFYTNLEFKLNSLPGNERAAFMCTEWLRRLANPINQPPYWLLGRSTEAGSPYVDFARYFITWWSVVDKENKQWQHIAVVMAYASVTKKLGAKFWVDKTPVNERYLDRIRKEMPRARIIQVIRDPLATISSRKKMEPLSPMRNVLIDLKMSYETAIENLDAETSRYLVLRYEELCDDSQKITGDITSFLNIQTSDTLSKPTVAGMAAQANSSFNKTAVPGEIIKRDEHSSGEILNEEEKELISAYLGDLPDKLNYQMPKVGLLRALNLKIKFRLS